MRPILIRHHPQPLPPAALAWPPPSADARSGTAPPAAPTLGPHRRANLRLVAFARSDRLIQRVALDGLLPRPADQRHDLVVRQPHGRRCAGLVIDALEYHCALEVVAAERERDLRDERRDDRQCVFTCGMLSSSSRATAMFLRSS